MASLATGKLSEEDSERLSKAFDKARRSSYTERADWARCARRFGRAASMGTTSWPASTLARGAADSAEAAHPLFAAQLPRRG